MEIRLHANARTTPKMRAYIQASRESVRSLSSELGVTETTIRRWLPYPPQPESKHVTARRRDHRRTSTKGGIEPKRYH